MARFSGRQIAAIIVSICAAVVLTPTMVYAAVSSTTVSIADPAHPAHKAHVDPRGQLIVGDGSGALTVNGTVGDRPVPPARPWNPVNYVSVSSGSPRANLFQGTNPTKLNLTSFTVSTSGGSGGTVTVSVQVYTSSTSGGDCVALTGASFGAAERFLVTVPDGQTVTVPYPTPLQYTQYGGAGDKYCVDVEGEGPSGYIAFISASGYLT